MMIPTIPTPEEILDKGFSRGKKQADLMRSQKIPKHLKGKRIEERRVVTSCQVIKDKLKIAGLKIVQMTGSGSAVFALSTDRHLIKSVARQLENQYQVEVTKVLK